LEKDFNGHGKSLKTPRQKFVNTTAKVCERQGKSLRTRPRQKYRIFSIKRRGRLFKTQPCRRGIYSGPSIYLLSGFFNHLFLSSVLEVY